MKKLEEIPKMGAYGFSERIEEIALRASEMTEFQDVVKKAKSKLEAITAVREILVDYFPEISKIPEPQKNNQEMAESQSKIRMEGILPPPSNEFMIAKNIVDLLFEK